MNFKITMLILMLVMIDPSRISKINSLKSAAQKAFKEGHYKEASQKYRYLIDSLDVHEDEVQLNLAHASYLAKDTAAARPLYQELTQSTKNEIRSKAFHQLGLMNNSIGKSEEALSQFKQAIKSNASNEDARYNYEMLKKKLEDQKKKDQQKDQNKNNKDQKEQDKKEDKNKQEQNKDKQNKENQKKEDQKKDQQDQQKKDQQNKDQEKKEQEQKKKDQQEKEDQEKKQQQEKKEQSQEEKDKQQKKDAEKVPQQVSDKLKQMNISEEKAKMILEAMKNQEVQYLQQNKRKATKPKDKGKPDW